MKVTKKRKIAVGILSLFLLVIVSGLIVNKITKNDLPDGVSIVKGHCYDAGYEGGRTCIPPIYEYQITVDTTINNAEEKRILYEQKRKEMCDKLGGNYKKTTVGGFVGTQNLCQVK